jgi:O-antigen ligase
VVLRRPGRPADVALRRAGLALAGVVLAVALGVAAAPSLDPAASGGERRAGFTHGRTGTWGAALDVWAQRPLVGHGADTFLQATAREQPGRPVRYAHDLPLEAAVELGALGLLTALALYAGAGLALRRARGTPALELLGPLVAVFLASNLVDWTWRLGGLGALWAVALGAVIAAAAPAARPST